VLNESQSLVVIGVNLDSKLTFEGHIREVLSSSSRALGIMREAGKLVESPDVLETCFRSYVFFRLEYCASARGSAVSCHLHSLNWSGSEGCSSVYGHNIG
jgi:hypothetical protein